MNRLMGLKIFPLQADVGDLWISDSASGIDAQIFAVGVAIVVMVLIILNVVKGRFKTSAGGGGKHLAANAPRNFSSFTLHRLTSDLGLNRDQVKMLDYVLRSGGISDPERFLDSPALIDRHFKRAYRLIERTSPNEDMLNERLSVLFSTRNILEANSSGSTANSTRQIPEKTAAVLTVGKVNYPVQIISARGDSLVVENPKRSAGGLLHLPRGSKANLAFFTKSSKGFSVETRILGAAEGATGPVLQLAHSGQIKKLASRRHRRHQTLIATGFYFVFPGEGKNKKSIVDKRRNVGNILDISAGGCSIKTNTMVTPGQKIKIEFTREDNSIVAALGEVLRTSKSGVSTVLHIKFLKVPRRSLNSINAMVYEYTEN